MAQTKRWDGSDDQYWWAVSVLTDESEDIDEQDAVIAAVVLQDVLTLAQDMLTLPEVASEDVPRMSGVHSVPAKVIKRTQPGDIVLAARAVELFAEGWVLQPVEPDKESPISPHRDYRLSSEGELQLNVGYPPKWQASGGAIADCAQWRALCKIEEPTGT